MIVRLTTKMAEQLAAIGNDEHREWLTKSATRASKNMWRCVMPPVGWKTLAEEIPAHAFGPLGGRKRDANTYGAALRRISKVLATLESHPAFQGVALPGKHYETFLAWGESPYPDVNYEPVVLLPVPIQRGEIVMTHWNRQYALWDLQVPLMTPAAHWAFMPPLTSPSAEPCPPLLGSSPAGTSASQES